MNETTRVGTRGARFIVPLHFFAAAVALAAVFLFAAQASYGQSDAGAGAVQRHLQHLRHGINLSEWFAQVYDPKGYSKEHFESWTTAEDIALIKSMGFDHVRLSVNPQPMMSRGHADEIPADYLSWLDTAVQMILKQGLAVVIDVHPESEFKTKLASEGEFTEQFTDYWRALARHYSKLDPDRVFFEI